MTLQYRCLRTKKKYDFMHVRWLVVFYNTINYILKIKHETSSSVTSVVI